MIGRGLAAILIGVAGAGLVNTILLTVVTGVSVPSLKEFLQGIVVIPITGIILTAPAWIIFCLMLLPVATYRARIGRKLSRRMYLIAAFMLGALLTAPVIAFMNSIEPLAWLMPPLLGGIGGLIIAQTWSFLVLDVISPVQDSGASRA